MAFLVFLAEQMVTLIAAFKSIDDKSEMWWLGVCDRV
jgi:hypothetical protein